MRYEEQPIPDDVDPEDVFRPADDGHSYRHNSDGEPACSRCGHEPWMWAEPCPGWPPAHKMGDEHRVVGT